MPQLLNLTDISTQIESFINKEFIFILLIFKPAYRHNVDITLKIWKEGKENGGLEKILQNISLDVMLTLRRCWLEKM